MNAFANLADERLLVEAAQRDPGRFAVLYEQNFDRVYAYVARRARDRSDAEDITAEVFHQALVNIGRFQWRGIPFAAWLLRIAANTLADRWQSSARNPELQLETPAEESGLEPVMEAVAERRAMLSQLVNRLSEDQRLVIVRRFVEQRSIREISQELGKTEGAIKQLQFRAMETLRNNMRSNHE